MDFFWIDGRNGPNILRLDFLFHIYIVDIANCILIKKKMRISVTLYLISGIKSAFLIF